jgi:hypothetical protein
LFARRKETARLPETLRSPLKTLLPLPLPT